MMPLSVSRTLTTLAGLLTVAAGAFSQPAPANPIIEGIAVHISPNGPPLPGGGGGGGGGPEQVAVDLTLVIWDDTGTFNVDDVTNNADNSDLADVELTISGGGLFDWIGTTGASFTVGTAFQANNDGLQDVTANLTWATGLAPAGSTDNNMTTGDIDGPITGIGVVASFENGDCIDGSMTYSAGTGPPMSLGEWTFAAAEDEGTATCDAGGGPPGGGGGGGGEVGEELTVGGTNRFINPNDANCSNSANNGQYPEEVSGANGPWCNNDAADGASFSTSNDVYIIVNSTQTGSTAELYNSTIGGVTSGNSCSSWFVIGSYYMDGSTPRRGLGSSGNARPLLRGTAGYWDRTENWVGGGTPGVVYPDSRYAGLLGADDGRWDCTRIENLSIHNVGGRGVTLANAQGVEYVNLYIKGTWDNGLTCTECIGAVFEGNEITHTNYARPVGNIFPVGAGISCVDCTQHRVRFNNLWDGSGEGINTFSFGGGGQTNHAIIEYNFVLDFDSTLLYADSVSRSIIRGNILARTSRQTFWRNPGQNYRGDAITHSDESCTFDPPSNPAADVVVYGNIIAANSDAMGLSQWGCSTIPNIYYYGNLFIDNDSTISFMDVAATGGRFWSNASILFTGGTAHINSTGGVYEPIAGFDAENNYWSSALPGGASHWSDGGDVVGGCTIVKTTGWRTLEDLSSRQSDNTYSIEQMEVVKAAIKAGAAPNSWAACTGTGVAIASRTFPANVTVESGPADTDVDGDPYATADIGAFAQ